MLIVVSLLQLGIRRAHVLYLAWALLGLVVMHSGWAAVYDSQTCRQAQPSGERTVPEPSGSGGRSSPLHRIGPQPVRVGLSCAP